MLKEFSKRKWNKKLITLVAVLSMTCILLGGSIGYIYAVNLSTYTYYGAGGQTETASYVIWKDGSTYYAKNGITGAIDYSGTDASTVIQNAFDATPTHGKVEFLGNKFIINTALKPHTMMEIKGNLYRTELNGVGAIKVFDLDGINSVRIDGFVISNDGTDAGSIGIYCLNTTFIEIRDVWCYGAEIGAKFEGDGVDQAIYTENFHTTNNKYGIEITGGLDEVRLVNSRIFDSSLRGINIHLVTGGVVHLVHTDLQCPYADYGIYVAEASNSEIKFEGGGIYGYENNSLVFSECTAPRINVADFTILAANQRGIWIYHTDNVRLNNVNVASCSRLTEDGYAGIHIDTSDHISITASKISGANHTYDIQEGVPSNNNWFVNNYFSTISKTGAATIVRGNQGYITENFGTATILNAQTSTGNVAHGLSITPTIVTATGSSADTEDLYVVSIGAANIEIAVAAGAVGGDRTVYWNAAYK